MLISPSDFPCQCCSQINQTTFLIRKLLPPDGFFHLCVEWRYETDEEKEVEANVEDKFRWKEKYNEKENIRGDNKNLLLKLMERQEVIGTKQEIKERKGGGGVVRLD